MESPINIDLYLWDYNNYIRYYAYYRVYLDKFGFNKLFQFE